MVAMIGIWLLVGIAAPWRLFQENPPADSSGIGLIFVLFGGIGTAFGIAFAAAFLQVLGRKRSAGVTLLIMFLLMGSCLLTLLLAGPLLVQ